MYVSGAHRRNLTRENSGRGQHRDHSISSYRARVIEVERRERQEDAENSSIYRWGRLSGIRGETKDNQVGDVFRAAVYQLCQILQTVMSQEGWEWNTGSDNLEPLQTDLEFFWPSGRDQSVIRLEGDQGGSRDSNTANFQKSFFWREQNNCKRMSKNVPAQDALQL